MYRAKWLDADVVVKQVMQASREDSGSALSWAGWAPSIALNGSEMEAKRRKVREMFSREVDVWFDLSHPHVVRLFGACHVGNPFFVCEYAPFGSLDKYLRQHPDELWEKLHEAALGVRYLHERGIVHGISSATTLWWGATARRK